jgi:hypothetical protein
MKEQIPPEISNLLDEAAKKYSESKATNDAGRFLRFLARFISPSTIIKLFAHKITNK